MYQQNILGSIIDHALERGANTCSIMMRQGVGMVVYDVGSLIEQIRTITPKEFADCNAILMPFLQVPGQHLAPMQSGTMGYNSIRGPITLTVRSFLHLEPVLSIQFTQTPPVPISFAELQLSNPTSLAIRQFLSSSQKMLFVTSDNTASDQLAFMQASLGVLSLYGKRPILYCGAPLPLTTPAVLNTHTIEPQFKKLPGWPKSMVMHNHFTPDTANILSTPPFPEKLVITDPSAIDLRQTVARNKQYLQMFIDPSIYMPAIPLYVQAMPRLCYRCRQAITMKKGDFEWLQTKLSGKVTVDYTTLDRPKPQMTAASGQPVTALGSLGGASLMDLIASDPDMVNRSEQDKYRKQNEIATMPVWLPVKNPACTVCQGTGQDGFVLCSGFGEINASDLNDANELATNQDRISGRFWVDVFDKVQNGLVGIDYLAKMAVAANTTSPAKTTTSAVPRPAIMPRPQTLEPIPVPPIPAPQVQAPPMQAPTPPMVPSVPPPAPVPVPLPIQTPPPVYVPPKPVAPPTPPAPIPMPIVARVEAPTVPPKPAAPPAPEPPLPVIPTPVPLPKPAPAPTPMPVTPPPAPIEDIQEETALEMLVRMPTLMVQPSATPPPPDPEMTTEEILSQPIINHSSSKKDQLLTEPPLEKPAQASTDEKVQTIAHDDEVPKGRPILIPEPKKPPSTKYNLEGGDATPKDVSI